MYITYCSTLGSTRFHGMLLSLSTTLWKSPRITSLVPCPSYICPPFHKGGAKDSVNNYRPVSLTSTCCKTLEHVLAKHLTEFLEEHKLMGEQQHGFRRGFSTVTILTEVTHFINRVLDDRGQVDIIFLDFRKAFDKIPHQKLLHKLSAILQNDELINWIRAYLTNREQVVCIKGTISTRRAVGSGVPQGSVIGPLLFSLYINDMNSGFSPDVFIKHYADDTVISYKVESNYNQEKLNEHLSMIGCWCKKWQMELNPSKTVFMPITRKTKPLLFRYVIHDEPLLRVSEYKYLGVYVTDSLNWNRHIDYICDKSQKKLWMLRRRLSEATPEVKLLAYKTTVLPLLEYACPIWKPYTQNNIAKCERVQNRALRFIFNSYRRTQSITSLRTKADILTVHERMNISSMKYFFQLFHGIYKTDIIKLCTLDTSHSRTKHSKHIKPFKCNTKSFEKSFIVSAVHTWNKLRNDVVLCNNVKDFEYALLN